MLRLAYAIRGVQDLRYFKPKTLPDLICAVHNNCEAENTFLGRLRMLAFNRLRIDPGNGSPAVDYRIENGFVESRTLETDATKRSTLAIEKQWQRLTPEQLTSRLMVDTVLLRWLRHRMGVYRLIRACNQDSSSPNNPALENCGPVWPCRTAEACNNNNRRVLERAEHQFGRKARKERVIGIVPAGWKLRLIRIKVASISDDRLV